MKKQLFGLAMALAITFASLMTLTASAEDFNFTYTGNGDGVVGSGVLTGDLSAPGQYLITSGNINVSGAGVLDGAGMFVTNPGTGVFQTGGGTQLILDGTNSFLYPSLVQGIDDNGIFLFQMSSGLGLGLFSNEPVGPGYGMFGGNWALNDQGSLNLTPEPSSLLLAGSGLLALAGVARRRLVRV